MEETPVTILFCTDYLFLLLLRDKFIIGTYHMYHINDTLFQIFKRQFLFFTFVNGWIERTNYSQIIITITVFYASSFHLSVNSWLLPSFWFFQSFLHFPINPLNVILILNIFPSNNNQRNNNNTETAYFEKYFAFNTCSFQHPSAQDKQKQSFQ